MQKMRNRKAIKTYGKQQDERSLLSIIILNINGLALAIVAQWIECWPVNQRVASSILSLGRMPGLWARSPVGGMREATIH